MEKSNFMPEKYEIDGVEFHIYPFSAIEALKIKAKVLGIIAPAFGRVFGDLDIKDNSKFSLQDVNLEGHSISEAIQMVCEKLSENEFEQLIKRMVAKVSCVYNDASGMMSGDLSNETVLNKVFTRRLSLIYKLIAKVVEVNYPDFFGIFRTIGQRFQTVMQQLPEKKQKESSKELEK